MLAADGARALALSSIVAALALHRLTFVQLVLVALVDGTGFVFFNVGERSALRSIVPDHQLTAALTRNQSREYAALLAGQPLGGVLFAVGRLVPFLVDAISYTVSIATLSFIRVPFQQAATTPERRHLLREIRAGLSWYWRQPFIRATSLLVTGSDFTLNALYLVVIVLAKQRGASPALVGSLFAFLGLGGLLGAAAAPWLTRRLSMRAIVVATQTSIAILVPLLILVPGRVAPGVLYGAMLFFHPAWNATVGAYRLRVAPLELQGRVASVATLLALGAVPLASLASGLLLQTTGTTPTLLAFTGVMFVVAFAALVTPAVRAAPEAA
jgi:hypothetical protein